MFDLKQDLDYERHLRTPRISKKWPLRTSAWVGVRTSLDESGSDLGTAGSGSDLGTASSGSDLSTAGSGGTEAQRRTSGDTLITRWRHNHSRVAAQSGTTHHSSIVA
jgi:hypothetical protein